MELILISLLYALLSRVGSDFNRTICQKFSMKTTKSQWSWALYDWANSAYATTVMAMFFPIFFKDYYSYGSSVQESTLRLGTGNSIAGFFLAVSAPFLGSLADSYYSKKKFLGFFSLVGIVFTAMLPFIQKGDSLNAIIVYSLGTLGFFGANIFYDSMIVDVANDDEMNRVSTFGYSLGYLGGGILALINALFVIKPEWFGLADKVEAVKASFFTVAAWWLIFTIPMMIWVKEKPRNQFIPVGEVYKHVWITFKKILKDKKIFLFLISYFFYIDGVNTIFKMAVDFGLSIGLKSQDLIIAILMVQFVGFPAAMFYYKLANDGNIKRSLYIGIFVYTLITCLGSFITTSTHFFIMAFAVALVQGGLQAMSRSYFALIIPKNSSTEYFGFFNLIGKCSTVLGPILVGGASYLSDSPRVSLFVVVILFIVGWVFLRMVPED